MTGITIKKSKTYKNSHINYDLSKYIMKFDAVNKNQKQT